MPDFLLILGPALACGAAGATGALFRPGAWYAGLAKPSWTPPNRAFPIVWTSLYVLMAAAAVVAGRAIPDAAPEAAAAGAAGLALWAGQITLNALWSPVFFGLRKPKLALGIIVALWCMVAATAWSFLAVSPLAAGLMAPALIWIALAAGLNFGVMTLNPASVFVAPQ